MHVFLPEYVHVKIFILGREGLNRLKLTGCMLTMCVIVFCVTGILLNYQLGKDKDWDTSQWYQIFYGAYILIILVGNIQSD